MNGITLYMQPVQDLTVEDRVSRTQYQYSMEDADAQSFDIGRRNLWTSYASCPHCVCGYGPADGAFKPIS